jgi:hypothetical protein
MLCHYCDKNNHNTTDYRAISKFKQQKKACFEAKSVPGKKSLVFLFLFEEINALKRQLKPERLQAVRRERLNPSSLLSTEINLTISSNEGEDYFFTVLSHQAHMI